MSPTSVILRDVWMNGATRLKAAGIEDARFEAEVLLRHACHRSRADLYANLQEPLDAAAQREFEAILARRSEREPLAYITGHREFFGLDLHVTPAVLIPRPESELVVETALAALRRQRLRDALVVDVGTGSGALGIAIAKNRRGARLVGVDNSREALDVAVENANRLIPRARRYWIQADLLTTLAGPIDCVVANLPYIPEERLPGLEPEVAEHEPRMALVTADQTGSELILRLLTQLGRRLGPRGVAALEIDPGLQDEVADAARRLIPNAQIDILKDLAGDPRVVRIVAG